MGAFKDYLDVLKASITGPVPYGGTIVPTSEGFPVAFAHNIKGASFPVASLAILADIPYQNLMIGMQFRVFSVDTQYKLFQLPAEGTRFSDIVDYDIADFWEEVTGGSGTPGPPGANGWSALYLPEEDGPTRVVEKFIDWVGGSGTKPAIPTPPADYRGSGAFVTKSLAVNIKGPQGNPGSDALVRPEYYETIGNRRITPPITNFPAAPGVWAFGSSPIQVNNTWTQPRRFMIFGEIPFTNVSGPTSWVVRLNHRGDIHWGGADEVTTSLMDENYGRADWVNASFHQSLFKINVRGVIQLAAGASRYFRMTMNFTNGGASKYDEGFIEVIGL